MSCTAWLPAPTVDAVTREQREIIRKQIEALMRERLGESRLRAVLVTRATRWKADGGGVVIGLGLTWSTRLVELGAADTADDPLVVLVQVGDAVLARDVETTAELRVIVEQAVQTDERDSEVVDASTSSGRVRRRRAP